MKTRRSSLLGLASGAAVLVLAPCVVRAQSSPPPAPPATIAVPANLVPDGIPPIPRAVVADVQRYTESRMAGLADWHPTRREILISTRFGSTNQIHLVAMPMGARKQLTFFEERVGEASYDPKTGRMIVLGRDTGGDEFTQLYRYDVADGRVTQLTAGGRSQNGNVVWCNAGDRFAYSSTARNGKDRDLRMMDPRDPKTTDRMLVQLEGAGFGIADWSPDDRTILALEYESVNRSHVWLVDVASGKKELLTPRSAADTVSYSNLAFSGDGKAVWLTTDRDSEFRRLAYLDLATRKITPITTDLPWDVEEVEPSPNGRTIAFCTNEAGASKLYLMDAATRSYRPVSKLPSGLVGSLDWRADGTELGFGMTSSRSPADVYSLIVKSGEIVRWTESELGGIVASELSIPDLIRWKSFDGLEITGFYYKSNARFTGKRPVIIQIHGGPEGQARPGFIARNNYFMNELGVAMIFPNVRGSLGFGKTFSKLDNAFLRENSVKDIGALLDWIAQQPELDASKVLVTGGSYGGYMTLASLVHFNDRLAAGVDMAGVSNYNTFFAKTEPYRQDLRRVEYGDERDPEVKAFFDRIAPVNNAQKISKPLFVVQGANDPRVPQAEAEQMVATVKKNGSPVWYLLAKDEGHGYRKKENNDYLFDASVMFVKRYLLGETTTAAEE
jgi:dipeptidyl aminopeptidase/acylaminoacyl peptidase